MVWSETESGEFNLFLDYTIGANATGMSIGLYQSGCVTNYTSDDPIISDITVPVDNKDVDKNIYVDKRLLSVNNTELVTHDKSKGLSKGSLDFCIKAETWVGDTSAAFHKQNLKLTFDLSVNSFEVLDNDITTGVVPRPNPDPIVSTFKSAQCVCDGTQDTYGTPDSCDFGDDSYMNAKFLSFAKTDVFGVSPIIIGDVFTFTRTFNPNAVKYKYITLLRARFETDANGNNKFNGLELNIFGITCTDRRRLEIPHRQLATVYANLVVTDVLNFLSGDGFLSLDFTATATGDINGESATVLHAGSLELTFPNGPNAPPATPVIDGTVAENIIGLSVLTVDTSKYTVTACRCTETAYACSEGVLPAYSQNDMIYLCVQPNATVQDTVEVSNFFMEFKHGADVKYTPVTIGKDGRPKPDTKQFKMFTATTFYRICIALVGAVSVRGDKCWIAPDENGRVVIPKGTKSIPEEAFIKCDALKKIKIPASVENIESYAFYKAVNLKKVIFQKGSRLKGIGDYSFEYCFNLKWINFPASLKQIGRYAFAASGLEKFIFKKGTRVEVIGDYVCYECRVLKMVILSANVKEIGINSFAYSSLEKVIFRKGTELETIGYDAFRGNENLKTITIPVGVEIEERAFEDTGCSEDIFTPGAKIVDCIAKTKGLRGN